MSYPVTDTAVMIKGLTISVALTGALIVLSFIIVDRCRIFRRNESPSLFVFILLAGIPLNIMVCRFFFWILSDIEEPGGGIVRLLAVPLVYCIMISFEEISCGIIGRLIWRYQKRMF